ncbi:cadmium-translocating P-type ATPase [Ralstonia insidiosa]|uniref:P-type Zn(2+) transporter n=1 Tax=Ralstonia insidiosa TaxID=190721 RepID=A0AAC9BIQ2_9RALS|nr:MULTISPECIES: heavy metal translocating P-type ATPase [Ralstonia]ANH74953.1 cadmium-translocating P-type ATPase [Ralstonia insidiosa]MBY4706410.1 heavy metal translocating P-type ATPase [Ralstonia insidiosa]GAQ27458.1 catioN-transporting ATPase [Ralstonia sp. NT80]
MESGFRHLNMALLAVSAATLAAGLLARYLNADALARDLWLVGVVPNWLALAVTITRSVMRRQAGVDVLALLSISFALVSGEVLVAAVIALMLASGRALEDFAQSRAQREMTALLSHAPKRANRFHSGQWQQVDLADVQAGDRLLVRHGEVVPVDGTLSEPADLDEATLTGESIARHRLAADAICSGVLNVGTAFEMVAGASAENSTFAGIVRLVSAAQAERSPSVRLADRYAVAFLGVTVFLAGVSWILTGDSTRCLAVLVVATPCPLILAVPVAIVAGMSRCAKRGVLVKGGGALEQLALADTLFFDKTGTLTSGYARLVDIECDHRYRPDMVLSLAGSLAQASNHVMAEAVAKAAHERGAALQLPSDVVENPGAGVQGRVGGHVVAIGTLPHVLGASDVPAWSKGFIKRVGYAGASAVFVGVDGELVGALQLVDRIRLETPRALRLLRQEGVPRQAMLTGDRPDVAESVGAMLGVTEVYASLSPAAKLAAIQEARAIGKVIMVGDGVNDAPALAAADIGVAMGARGAAASSEAADVVLLVDRLDRLVEAVRIARRTRQIALQSVAIGMSMSLVAMAAAALGYLPPLAGAMLQEVIDVLVIANALRALRPAANEAMLSLAPADVERLKAEHAELEPIMDRIRIMADTLPHMEGSAARAELLALNRSLTEVLVPHERRDDTELYPDVARLLGGEDPMAAMSGMHREIFRVTNVLGRIVADISAEGPDALVTQELQRLLYGLEAVLRLHCAQEDELFHVLGREA